MTFLFTDIEGSTRHWEADPEGMRSALAAHDELLRAAIEGEGGWVFKHTGDGVSAGLRGVLPGRPKPLPLVRFRYRMLNFGRRG